MLQFFGVPLSDALAGHVNLKKDILLFLCPDSSMLTDLLGLRILIGYLGEKHQFGWWDTSFFDAASIAFILPVFTKTPFLAQYHGAVEAARLVHDERLSNGCFHLFRLPEEIEQDLHALLLATKNYELQELVPISTEGAVGRLTSFAGSSTVHHSGPVSLGSIEQMNDKAFVEDFASSYLHAFANRSQVFPYVSGKV